MLIRYLTFDPSGKQVLTEVEIASDGFFNYRITTPTLIPIDKIARTPQLEITSGSLEVEGALEIG
jgi:hypothetical protein